jgi:DNA-binding transcriptional MerR regulator
MAEALKIGEVARRSGVTVDTVRFYERRGVLPTPLRRASGYRQYSDATIDRIRFAKALQALGFTLDEVAGVLLDVDAGVASCERERPRFETVLARIDEKISELAAIRRDLLATLKRCRDGRCTFREKAPRGTSASAQRTRKLGVRRKRA